MGVLARATLAAIVALVFLAVARLPAFAGTFDKTLATAARDVCAKQVVLLGEAAHGDGATEAFKTGLVRRLIQRCGFRALFFEASHYDFLEIERQVAAGKPVTGGMVSSAIGGLWNRDQPVAEMSSFLAQ